MPSRNEQSQFYFGPIYNTRVRGVKVCFSHIHIELMLAWFVQQTFVLGTLFPLMFCYICCLQWDKKLDE